MKAALLLDSSSSYLYVGLSRDGVVLDRSEYLASQRHSEVMVPEIEHILERNNLGKEDLEAVVVGKGPGSYTGVRISMAIGKTICLALGIPLYTVSSLRAFAEEDKPSICLLNARGKRSYIGVYENDDVLLADTIMDNSLVLEYIKEHPGYSICGEISHLGLPEIQQHVLNGLAKCVQERYLDNCLSARPIYLKDSMNSELKIIVRKMNSADIKQVIEIENSCFEQPYEEKDFKYALLEDPFGRLLVAMSGPEIVGYINYEHTFDSATINRIAVKKEYRKRGVGKLLLNECIKNCASAEEPAEFLTLEVRESNDAAHDFYKHNGFEDIVVKPAYYPDGEDAIYMVRSIINEQDPSH